MTSAQVGFAVAAAAAALYGLLLEGRPPDWRRTVVKAAGAVALALAARLADAPPMLALALGLSAAGDAALAGDPERTLTGGLVAFLLAHLAYVTLFAELGDVHALFAQPSRLALAALAYAAAGGLLAWLWPRLGAMRAPVAIYALVIATMAASSLTLMAAFWPAMLGAGLFMASDAILAARLFRGAGRRNRVADQLVWWLYAGAQGCIAWAFLRPWRL